MLKKFQKLVNRKHMFLQKRSFYVQKGSEFLGLDSRCARNKLMPMVLPATRTGAHTKER
jgi:hypothetical protein